MHTVLAFGFPGLGEWAVIGIAALFVFYRRIPSAGRSLGQGIMEFHRALFGGDSGTSADRLPSATPAVKSTGSDPSYDRAENCPRK